MPGKGHRKTGAVGADLFGIPLVELGELCEKGSSHIAQKDLENRDGDYPIYGAGGLIKHVDFYQQETPYIAIVKDGAGVGRVMRLPAKSSVIGTLQYILPRDHVDVGYLAYALEHMHLSKYHTGATIPHIYFKDYKKEKLPLPPLEEQVRIAALLDKVSGLIAKRQAQADKLDELAKARFAEMFGDPRVNPHGFAEKHLSEIAVYFNGLTYRPEDVAEQGTIVLRSSNIQNNQLDFQDTVRVACAVRDRLLVRENDILMCSRNGSESLVGKAALIQHVQEPMSFGAFMMIIRSDYYSYLLTYFQTDAFRQQIRTSATTTIHQITGRMLDDIVIPVPPLPIVGQYKNFMEQTSQTKLRIQQNLDQLKTLKEALMQQYWG